MVKCQPWLTLHHNIVANCIPFVLASQIQRVDQTLLFLRGLATPDYVQRCSSLIRANSTLPTVIAYHGRNRLYTPQLSSYGDHTSALWYDKSHSYLHLRYDKSSYIYLHLGVYKPIHRPIIPYIHTYIHTYISYIQQFSGLTSQYRLGIYWEHNVNIKVHTETIIVYGV